jgi:hypothetical protein
VPRARRLSPARASQPLDMPTWCDWGLVRNLGAHVIGWKQRFARMAVFGRIIRGIFDGLAQKELQMPTARRR